jgi:hypothetical protein
MRRPTVMIKIFLKRMLIVFFCRVRPISRKAKPECIKNTRAVQTIIQTLLAVNVAVSMSI